MEALDEMSGFFNRETPPKMLVTTADHGSHRTIKFARDLADVVPNAKYYYRKGLPLKKIIKQCESNGYTELIVINEDRRVPNGLILCHLPDGPTAHFKLTSSKLAKEMTKMKKRCKKFDKEVKPEVILNNFNTMLGHRVGRMLASVFSLRPRLRRSSRGDVSQPARLHLLPSSFVRVQRGRKEGGPPGDRTEIHAQTPLLAKG